LYNKKLHNNNPPLKIKKILLSVISSFALGPSLHANTLTNNELDNNWNCQQINGLWHCSGVDIDTSNSVKQNTIAAHLNGTPKTAQASQQNKTPEPVFITPIGPTGGTAVSRTEQYTLAKRSNCSSQITTKTNHSASEQFFNNNNRAKDLTTRIEADEAVATDKNIIDFEGDVVITRDDQQLLADKASYNKTDEFFTAQGNVEISQPGVTFQGDSASYQTQSREGKLKHSSYQLPAQLTQSPAQGKATNLQFEPGLIKMTDPTFSSCPASAEDWVIKTSEMNLYTEAGYGDGKHAIVYFKGIPFFYSPYIQFPLNDKRSSGFLLPEVGYSSKNGADFSTPYYWNIAPNMDATITPRVLSKRGMMLGSQFRYLGENQYAELYAEYLNDSSPNEDREAEEIAVRGDNISANRGSVSLQHDARLSQSWNSHVDFNYVSDNYYIDDFGNNLKDRSVNHLLREGRISYANSFLNFSGTVQGYQELRQDVNTYSRLPQILLSSYNTFQPAGIPLGAGFNSEAVVFAKNWDFNQAADEGQRYTIRPYVDIPYTRQYGFIKPKVSLDMVQYSLSETQTAGAETDFNRTLPIISLDSGLFFEKELSLFNTEMLQTLEPRLFYLYVPHDDQNNQPLFDTTLNHFTFSQLFRENRFSGNDRLGDANQISFALTSRFFDNSNGFERFRASIGQVVYFQDREVQLNSASPIETTSTSAIATEVASHFLPHWNTSLSMMYDPHQSEIDTSTFRLQYKSDAYHIINFDYTYKADGTVTENYDQVDLSAYWKVAPQWRALARWNYSMQDSFSLESMLGLEYDSCCYAMRLVVSREQAYETDKADNRLMLQMQFKGLASIGNISDRTLSNDIPGFEKIMDE
jgi:LPS-assembly protein